MTFLSKIISAATFGMLFLALAACNSTNSESDQKDAVLDLETLEAETEFGTLHAQRADNSFVGPLGEGRAIGITFLDEVGAEANSEDEIFVHLYDGDQLAVLIGVLDTDGSATLESSELSDFETTVELTMDEDAVTGTATFQGENPTSFTANHAIGIAGIYWADGTSKASDVSADWVVLSDERQWGCVCVPPYTGPCCTLRL